MTNDQWIEIAKLIVTSSVTMIAAGTVGYFAYRQWKTAHAKVKLDLFDRRYAIFRAVIEVLDAATEYNFPSSPALRLEASQSMFLFNDAVWHLIVEVSVRVSQAAEAYSLPTGDQQEAHRPIMEAGEAAMRWIQSDAYGKARNLFLPYLDFKTLV